MDSLTAKANSTDGTNPDRVSVGFDESKQSGDGRAYAIVSRIHNAEKNIASKKLNSKKKSSKIDDDNLSSQKSNRITLRLFEQVDIEQVRALIISLHENTVYADHRFSNKKFEGHVQKILSKPDNMVCIVAEKNSRIIGTAWASAGQYAVCEDLILTSCHVIAVDPVELSPILRAKTFLRLISGIKKWSDSIGAQEVLVHVTTGTNLKATDRLLRRSGAKCIGGGYVV